MADALDTGEVDITNSDPFNLIALEAWRAGEWVHSGTTFYFDKMPAMQGWRTLEQIREELGRSPSIADAQDGDAFIGFLRVLMSLNSDFVDRLRQTMFKYVMFNNENTTRQKLLGAEDMAFGNMAPIIVYQVLGRSLVVNFFESFAEILSPDSQNQL